MFIKRNSSLRIIGPRFLDTASNKHLTHLTCGGTHSFTQNRFVFSSLNSFVNAPAVRKIHNNCPKWSFLRVGLSLVNKQLTMGHCSYWWFAFAVDGMWGTWTAWTTCSATCGYGTRERKRLCNNPKPAYNGASCVGIGYQKRRCHAYYPCPGN